MMVVWLEMTCPSQEECGSRKIVDDLIFGRQLFWVFSWVGVGIIWISEGRVLSPPHNRTKSKITVTTMSSSSLLNR